MFFNLLLCFWICLVSIIILVCNSQYYHELSIRFLGTLFQKLWFFNSLLTFLMNREKKSIKNVIPFSYLWINQRLYFQNTHSQIKGNFYVCMFVNQTKMYVQNKHYFEHFFYFNSAKNKIKSRRII